MELVEGQPLSAVLRPGSPMDPDAVRDLLAQAADGLGAAHDNGIVHRDVKPANLIVTPDRQVKVTDFGIARAAEGVGLTSTGEVMGTPQYLSPEQAQGLTATPASDVYSLGVVAFECLAGRRPFVAETAVATALAHLREPVPDLPPSIPGDLAAVVRRSLAKDPAERFVDGRAFAAALRSPATVAAPVVVAPVPLPIAPGPVPDEGEERSWFWPVLAVVALVALVVLIILLMTRGGDDPDPTDDASTSPSASSSAPSSPSAPTSSASKDTTVRIDEDDYLDRPRADVQRELADLGLRVITDEVDNPGDEIEGDVQGVNPTGGLQPGDTVTVSYWGPAPPESPTPAPESQSASQSASPSEAATAATTDSTSPSS